MFQSTLLAGKRILITGGGTGLGYSMGRRFLELGARLAICGRRVEVLEKHPTSGFKKEAALELSAVQSKLGNPQEAAEAMKAAVSQMSESEKQQAAQTIAETYARTGEAGEAARFAARALDNAQIA